MRGTHRPIARRMSVPLTDGHSSSSDRSSGVARGAAMPHDPLYSSTAWRRLRKVKLAEEPLCRHCIARGGAPFDAANLQSLCRPCHARKTRVDEGKSAQLGCDINGMPIDPEHEW